MPIDKDTLKKLEDAQMKGEALLLPWPEVCNIITYIRELEKEAKKK